MAGRQDRGTGLFTDSVGFQRIERAERESAFKGRQQALHDLEQRERAKLLRNTNTFALSLVATEALKYEGKGYTYKGGGTGEDKTFDCSGLVFRAIKDSGYNPTIEHKSAIEYRSRTWSIPIKEEDVLMGDLVHFDNGDNTYHVGIVYSPQLKTMINANNRGVVVSDIYGSNWIGKLNGYTRPKRMSD